MLSIASSISFLALEGADWQQIVVLLLFLFFGLGKAILDKVRGKPPAARPGRRVEAVPSAPSAPPSKQPTTPAERGPRDVRELWDEIAAGVREESPQSAPPPPAPPRQDRAAKPLGIDLLEVEDELPSHHEEYFESHAAPDGAQGRRRLAPIHHVAAPAASKRRPSPGARLHEMIGDRDAWRRAIVLAEVLGPPLALRKSEQVPGLR